MRKINIFFVAVLEIISLFRKVQYATELKETKNSKIIMISKQKQQRIDMFEYSILKRLLIFHTKINNAPNVGI